jgi:hypothetical protein
MSNPTRIRILTEIDQVGACTVPMAELGEAFRHEQHWRNWAALWNLRVDMSMSHADGDLAVFTRKPKGI